MKKITFLAFTLIASAPLLAQNWTGAVSADWNNPANWSATPGNGSDITIDRSNYSGAMADPSITSASSFTPGEMLVQNGAVLTISATLNASDRVEIIGAGTEVRITAGGSFSLNGGGNNARLIFMDDAHLQVNGGMLNVGQRLLFELGATGEVAGGTVVVGQTLALVDGSALGSSKLIQTGGTITANGEFGFENESGAFFPAFEQTGGALYINGALSWLGAAPGSGRGYFRSSGGMVQVTGAISNDPASTMGMQIDLWGSSIFENVGSSVNLLAGDSILIRENAQWKDLITVAWNNAGVLHSSGEGFFQAGNTTLNGTGTYRFKHLNVPAGKAFNHVSPAIAYVSGSIEASGTFTHQANKLIFDGNTQQDIFAAPGLTLYDMEVANTSDGTGGNYGIRLLSNITVNHSLNLADGIIATAPSATLKISSGATVTGGSETSFVAGYMEKTGNQAFTFPLGSIPDRYRPLTVSAPASAATVIRTTYKHAPYTSLSPAEAPLQSVSAIEYWDLSRTGSADLFAASVGWNNAAESGLTDCASLALAAWDGTQWAFITSTTTGLCDGNNAGTLDGAQLPVIGPLTIGFMQGVTQNPVTICAGESYAIGSSTYTDAGVYIDILEDMNGNDSTVVTVLTVAAPIVTTVTNHITHLASNAPGAAYQWIDCGNNNEAIAGETAATFFPAANGSYAVIITVGNCTDTSACAIISQLGIEEHAASSISLSPNPQESHGVLTVSAATGISSYEIVTADGRTVISGTSDASGNQVTVTLPGLPAGMYLFRAGSESWQSVRRFIVK